MIYIAYYTSKSGIWLVISRVASYFHEPKASPNTAYECLRNRGDIIRHYTRI